MSFNVDDKELSVVLGLPAENRYDYFVRKAAEFGEVWGVGDDVGWSLVADEDGHECVPVWPASRFAAAVCTDDWDTRRPKAITLAEWLGQWLPGMAADGRLVEVFSTPTDDGLVAPPEKMADDLERQLGNR